MKPPAWPRILGASAAFLLLGAAALFVRQEVQSTLSDATAGAAFQYHQMLYDFDHGRPFQQSVGHTGSSGIRYNPSAYCNTTANHVNITHFLFAPLYRLWPSIAGCYALVLFVNYLGIAFWIFKIFSRKGEPLPGTKIALALGALFLSSGLFWTVTSKNTPLLYLGPFFFALYYFSLSGNSLGYWLSLALCCGISEDAALFMVSWSSYLFLFEPKQRRQALLTGILAAAWSIFAIKFLNVWARTGMELTAGSNVSGQWHWAIGVGRSMILGNFSELLRAIAVFSPIIIFSAAAFHEKPRTCLPKALGLVFLAPMTHWGISIITGGDHHWLPVFLCLLVLVCELMRGQPAALPLQGRLRGLPAWALGIFIALNAFGLYYNPLKHFVRQSVLPRLMGYPAPNYKAKISHNRRVLDFIRTLPKERAFVFWLDPNMMGFVADRSDFWIFPDFFSRADFLVIDRLAPDQPGIATDVSLRLPAPEKDFLCSLTDAKGFLRVQDAPKIANYLASSYRIINKDADLLVLERLQKIPFLMPKSTIGFGFLNRATSR